MVLGKVYLQNMLDKLQKFQVYLLPLICILMILSPINSLAAAGTVSSSVKLEINGQLISENEGATIIAGRSMVPLKTVTDSLGIPVLWFDSTRIIKVEDTSGPIFLKIGDSEANIDGHKVQLDVPPMLEGGQTLVPLRFIAEALRAEVEWFPEEKLIRVKRSNLNDITFESYKEQVRVIFELTDPEKYEAFRLHEPERLVIDIPDTQYNQKRKLLTVHHNLLTSIRVSQFQKEPSIVRVVLDLSGAEIDYQIHVLPLQQKLVIDLFTPGTEIEEYIAEPQPSTPAIKALQNKIIVIDPGHGGKNPGAIGITGLYESEVNYDIAQKLIKLLQAAGAYTIMTRKSDEDPGLYERAEIANENRADLFISIHADAHPKEVTHGSTVYGHYNATKDNWAFAWYVHEEIIKNTGLASKGLRAADFVVLRETKAPAILIETAYLSNREDEALLKDSEFRQKVAEGILNGVIRYYTTKDN